MGGMRYRKLRIAWSVFWGLVAVPLIMLWLRSYQWTDHVLGDFGSQYTEFITQQGQLSIDNPRALGAVFRFKWEYERLDAGDYGGHNPSWLPHHYLSPEILTIPLWMTVAIPYGLALLSWVPRRFSLRTLLIATTLVAVLLGAVIWAVR
jgi:hypothetical protein